MMIGRRLEEYLPVATTHGARRRAAARRGAVEPGQVRATSRFTLRAGEVVGLAGLVGAGRSEVAQALFGLDPERDGTRRGARASRSALALAGGGDARRASACVPEDRKRQGLVLPHERARTTSTLPILRALVALRLASAAGAERALAGDVLRRGCACARRASTRSTAGLSGGNQQKLVLAKWLAARCRVLILDEPTRGVDVGAKAEIHALIDELARRGHRRSS